MKHVLRLSLFFSIVSSSLIAQNEVELRTDGIVVPRTDTTAVTSPVAGMMIYDTTVHLYTFYNGQKWNRIGGSVEQANSFDSDVTITGNLTIGQDNTQDSIAGMLRWDSLSMTFQGYNGSEWVTFTHPTTPPMMTDTLEIGDSFGGGIVFFTSNGHGLVVVEFNLSLPSNLIETAIPWGPTFSNIAAFDESDGATNTTLIVSTLLDTYENGEYAAKICDDLIRGGYDDWYLPAINEFIILNQNIGMLASGPLNNLAMLDNSFYWTSTSSGNSNARAYRPDTQANLSLTKTSTMLVRAIRAY